MIAFELRGGSARHAEALLRELKQPPAALSDAVAKAVAHEVAKDEELKRLQAVERAYDPQVGGQQRLLVALAVGGTISQLRDASAVRRNLAAGWTSSPA